MLLEQHTHLFGGIKDHPHCPVGGWFLSRNEYQLIVLHATATSLATAATSSLIKNQALTAYRDSVGGNVASFHALTQLTYFFRFSTA
jgi:hypothetical protein